MQNLGGKQSVLWGIGKQRMGQEIQPKSSQQEIATKLGETKLNLFKNRKIQNEVKVGRLKITKKLKNCTWLKKVQFRSIF